MKHPGGGRHRIGRWLPHQDALEDWLEGLVKDIQVERGAAKLHPAVEDFRELINGDPIVRLLITQMIEQVPHTKPYTRRHLHDVDQLLRLIDEVIGLRARVQRDRFRRGSVERRPRLVHGDPGRVCRVPERCDQRGPPQDPQGVV